VGKQQELRVKTKEGREIPVEVSFSPINTSKGLLISAALRDISQRKMAESALARSEIKFRTLYVSTSEAVMLWDERGFFDCNDATLAIFGCATKEGFYTKQPSDFSPPQQPCGRNSSDCSKEVIAKALEQGSHSFEWLHRRIDNGKDFPAEVVLSSMELDGKLVLLGTYGILLTASNTKKNSFNWLKLKASYCNRRRWLRLVNWLPALPTN